VSCSQNGIAVIGDIRWDKVHRSRIERTRSCHFKRQWYRWNYFSPYSKYIIFHHLCFAIIDLIWTSGRDSCDNVAWCSTNKTSKVVLQNKNSSAQCVAFKSKEQRFTFEDCDKPQRFICEVSCNRGFIYILYL